jgi:hypothetical protein
MKQVAMLVSSSALKMDVIRYSETFVEFHWTVNCYISENKTLRNYRCENLNINNLSEISHVVRSL